MVPSTCQLLCGSANVMHRFQSHPVCPNYQRDFDKNLSRNILSVLFLKVHLPQSHCDSWRIDEKLLAPGPSWHAKYSLACSWSHWCTEGSQEVALKPWGLWSHRLSSNWPDPSQIGHHRKFCWEACPSGTDAHARICCSACTWRSSIVLLSSYRGLCTTCFCEAIRPSGWISLLQNWSPRVRQETVFLSFCQNRRWISLDFRERVFVHRPIAQLEVYQAGNA